MYETPLAVAISRRECVNVFSVWGDERICFFFLKFYKVQRKKKYSPLIETHASVVVRSLVASHHDRGKVEETDGET